MTERPELKLVDTATGEVFQPELENQDFHDLRIEHEELTKKYLGALGEIGKLKKHLAEIRGIEPESETIHEVLDYWRDRCKPRAQFPREGPRWQKCRARLREKLEDRPPLTPAELMLAVDGALVDRWHSQQGQGHRLDAEFLFRSYESVEKLRDLALGFQGKANISLAELLDVFGPLSAVEWKHLLQACECGHRRIEHARGDPHHEGAERCFMCPCTDFYQDWLEQLNEYEKRNFSRRSEG